MFLFDKLQLDSKRIYTDEGYLIADARICRTGIQQYKGFELGLNDRAEEVINVYRPEEEVFNKNSSSSFANKLITNNHPPEPVNAENAKIYGVGHSDSKVEKDGIFLKTKITVTDAAAIKDIESGKVELSNGYTSDLVWTSGVTADGENYEAVQTNIKGNHIAIVANGRAGVECRISDKNYEGLNVDDKIFIDGVEYATTKQVVQAVNKLQKELKDSKEELEEKDKELEEKDKEMKKQEDSKQALIDDLKTKILDQTAIDKLLSERLELIDTALKLSDNLVWKDKSNLDIMSEVVKNNRPNLDINNVSDDYIKASFDILNENLNSNSQFKLDHAFSNMPTNSSNVIKYESQSEKARKAFIEKNRNKEG